ncbi:MAG: helix-turn-helix domain-containing protein [Burkholderiaceae bacterium]
MSIRRVSVNPAKPASIPEGRFDAGVFEQTTEADLARQQQEDDAQALLDMASYTRGVRRRLGLSQREFATRINVSLDTIRNWEQGRRYPTGAAKALLRILDKAPQVCLDALGG